MSTEKAVVSATKAAVLMRMLVIALFRCLACL